MEVNEENVLEVLKNLYPNGDPKFIEMMYEEMELYNRKNFDYASGAEGEITDPNGNFNRVAQFFGMYPDIPLNDPRVICLAYIMKQIDQVAWSLSRGFEGKVEGLDPRLQDIAVYTNILKVLNAHILEDEQKAKLPYYEFSTTTNAGDGITYEINIPSVQTDQPIIIPHAHIGHDFDPQWNPPVTA